MKENAIMPDTDTLLADVSAVVVAVICSDSCGCDRCWSDSSSSWLLNWSRWSTVHFHKWPRNTCINVAAPPITTTGIAVTVDVCRADEWFIWVSVVVDSYKENSCLNHRLLTRAGGCRHFQKIVDNLKPLKFPWYTYKHIYLICTMNEFSWLCQHDRLTSTTLLRKAVCLAEVKLEQIHWLQCSSLCTRAMMSNGYFLRLCRPIWLSRVLPTATEDTLSSLLVASAVKDSNSGSQYT